MGKYKELVHKLPENKETMEFLTDLTDEFVESVRLTHPQKYTNFIEEIKEISSKHHFNEDKLKESEKHVNRYFDIIDSTNHAKEDFDIDFTKESFNKYDFNFILNEMYKTFCNVHGDDMNKYIELSLAWLDQHDGKAMDYYRKMYLNE